MAEHSLSFQKRWVVGTPHRKIEYGQNFRRQSSYTHSIIQSAEYSSAEELLGKAKKPAAGHFQACPEAPRGALVYKSQPRQALPAIVRCCGRWPPAKYTRNHVGPAWRALTAQSHSGQRLAPSQSLKTYLPGMPGSSLRAPDEAGSLSQWPWDRRVNPKAAVREIQPETAIRPLDERA
jgi:hypothetical protein